MVLKQLLARYAIGSILLASLLGFNWHTPVDGPCSTLAFVPITPEGASPPKKCDSAVNQFSCQVAEGFSRFGTTQIGNVTHYRIKQVNAWDPEVRRYVVPLEESKAIAEVNRLRIIARQMVGSANVCEPQYVYVGEKKVFGLGPVFVDSAHFLVDGETRTSNLMFLEDGTLGVIDKSVLTKDSLIEGSYYDIVVAHEIAHGIMQDLYGVDALAALVEQSVTRDPHVASAVTDPALAWVEGFAEGFEAYLGERFLTDEQVEPAFLNSVLSHQVRRMEMYERNRLTYYLTLPDSLTDLVSMMNPDFMTDFIKAERQLPIRENHYVTKGIVNNLQHQYELNFANMLNFGSATDEDSDAAANWQLEEIDTLASKEGVVGHLIYAFLKRGLAREIFETIRQEKPKNVIEFLNAFPKYVMPFLHELALDPVYKATFTQRGLVATKDFVQMTVARRNGASIRGDLSALLDKELAKITVKPIIVQPKEMWLEFSGTSQMRNIFIGYLDRINLATASYGRVKAMFSTFFRKTEDKDLNRAYESFVRARESFQGAQTLEEFLYRWSFNVSGDDRKLVEFVSRKIMTARKCYIEQCIAKGPKDL